MIAAAAPPAIVPKGLSAKENSQSTDETRRAQAQRAAAGREHHAEGDGPSVKGSFH